MRNPFLPQTAKIIDIYPDAPGTKIFIIKPREKMNFHAGQFLEVSLPKIGEAPFAFCSSQYQNQKFKITVQQKGVLTESLFKLKKGSALGIRGPFGRGFPMQKLLHKNILLVAGGIGLAPLRSVIASIIDRRASYKKIQVFYGTRCSELRIFEKEFPDWEKNNIEIKVTLDQCDLKWHGDIGVITTLFEKYPIPKNAITFVVGPPTMYKFVLEKLKKLKFKDENIYLSLERRMHCGIGLCQHCSLTNGKYVCKDGPVFAWSEIKNLPNVI